MNFDTSNFCDNFFNASLSRIADAPLKFIVVEKAIDIYNNADIMDFNKDNLLDSDFIMGNLYMKEFSSYHLHHSI